MIPESWKAPSAKKRKVYSTVGGHASRREEMMAIVCACIAMMMIVVCDAREQRAIIL